MRQTGHLTIYMQIQRRNQMQRQKVFDKNSLINLLTKTSFSVEEIGGYFIKLFHHERMQNLPKRIEMKRI